MLYRRLSARLVIWSIEGLGVLGTVLVSVGVLAMAVGAAVALGASSEVAAALWPGCSFVVSVVDSFGRSGGHVLCETYRRARSGAARRHATVERAEVGQPEPVAA